jgi:hypothetical protein
VSGRSTDISGIRKFVSITAGSTIYPATRAVIVTVAGTIDIVDADGNTVAGVPVVVGVNPYQVTKISAATATGLFLGY